MSYMATNAVVTSKGQIVIPAEIRKKYGITKGTRISFVEVKGNLIMQPINEAFIESLEGCLKDRKPSLSEVLRRERKKDWLP